MSLTRRTFIASGTAAAITLAAEKVLAQTTTAAGTLPAKSEIYVGKGSAESTIAKVIEKMGGMGRFVKPDGRVLIKPNISFTSPADWGTNTSPEVVAIVAQMCVKAGAKRVIVCDFPMGDPAMCKEKSGIAAALKDIKEVVIFTPTQEQLFEEKTNDKAQQLTRVKLVKELARVDSFISLPTLKSHSATGVSFGIKGLMGLVWDRGAFHNSMELHRAVAEQLYYLKPTLTLIDGTRALLNNGPGGPGTVAQIGTYVAGTDPVAVDSYAVTLASWYGKKFEGKQVQHIKMAGELGFGNFESAKISEIAV